MPAFADPFASPYDGDQEPSPGEAAAADLGSDIMFARTGYVTTPAGDYETVNGLEAYRQWVRFVLSINPGEMRLRPELGAGLRAAVKEAMTPARKDQLRLAIIQQLFRDPRTERADATVTEETRNGVRVVVVRVRAQALGRVVDFEPLDFARAA